MVESINAKNNLNNMNPHMDFRARKQLLRRKRKMMRKIKTILQNQKVNRKIRSLNNRIKKKVNRKRKNRMNNLKLNRKKKFDILSQYNMSTQGN